MSSSASVHLSASFEENGRAFACPGELVTFTCKTFRSTTAQLVAKDFMCRTFPVSYVANDPIGSPGTSLPTDLFQTNLTNIQRELKEPLVANFTATLKVNTTDKTADTVVECFGLRELFCDVQRKRLTQSGTYNIKSKLMIEAEILLG